MTDKIRLDHESASAGVRRLTGISNGLTSTWASIRAEIAGINAGTPWGDDEAGKNFDKDYSKGNSPEGTAAKALDAGDKLVARMKELGPAVQSSVDGTISADELAAKLFKKDGTGSTKAGRAV
jgi:hypothetical protein